MLALPHHPRRFHSSIQQKGEQESQGVLLGPRSDCVHGSRPAQHEGHVPRASQALGLRLPRCICYVTAETGTVQVVLTSRVPKLGDAGELVTVQAGHMANFLLPQGMAKPATPAILKYAPPPVAPNFLPFTCWAAPTQALRF